MKNQQNQRLLYDTECKNCSYKSECEYTETPQCCRKITDKLRVELRKSGKHREIVANITSNGTFALQEPYVFGKPFMRAEIMGEGNGGTFSTEYYRWKKK